MEEAHDEIERRWLVSAIDGKMLRAKSSCIKQGYFSTGGQSPPRIRIEGGKATFTKKLGKGKKRREINYEVADLAFAERLYAEACKYRCPKLRRVVDGWEIDSMAAPLTRVILVEREFPNDNDTNIAIPRWFQGIEVTDATCNSHGISLGSRDIAIIRHVIENNLDPASRGQEFKKRYELVMDTVERLKVY